MNKYKVSKVEICSDNKVKIVVNNDETKETFSGLVDMFELFNEISGNINLIFHDYDKTFNVESKDFLKKVADGFLEQRNK